MSIDLEKIKEKYEKLSSKATGNGDGGGFKNTFWNPSEGTNTIRILPAKDEDTLFYSETKIHRVLRQGNDHTSNVICLEVTEGRGKCPLCDLYRALYKTKNKAHEELAKKIKPRERYFINVVSRVDPTLPAEVKIFSLGSQLFQKIIGTILDSDFGDITDLESGFDFKVHKAMVDGYPNYNQSGARPKSSPAGTKQEIAMFKETMHDLSPFVKAKDYSDVKAIALEIAPPELANVVSTVETITKGDKKISESDFNKLRA